MKLLVFNTKKALMDFYWDDHKDYVHYDVVKDTYRDECIKAFIGEIPEIKKSSELIITFNSEEERNDFNDRLYHEVRLKT